MKLFKAAGCLNAVSQNKSKISFCTLRGKVEFVYRVVTKCLDHQGKWLVEFGPWLPACQDAEAWVEQLQRLGYIATIDTMKGSISGVSDDQDFMSALSSMA
jgi:hypothetical protein